MVTFRMVSTIFAPAVPLSAPLVIPKSVSHVQLITTSSLEHATLPAPRKHLTLFYPIVETVLSTAVYYATHLEYVPFA
jgi:hypothetical protein